MGKSAWVNLSMDALDMASPVHVVERPEADKSRAVPCAVCQDAPEALLRRPGSGPALRPAFRPVLRPPGALAASVRAVLGCTDSLRQGDRQLPRPKGEEEGGEGQA